MGPRCIQRGPTSIASQGPGEATVTVVGFYTPDPSDPTLATPGSTAGRAAAVTADPLLMTTPEAITLGLEVSLHGRLDVTPDLSLDQRASARATVDAVQAAILTQQRTITIESGLPGVLDRFGSQLQLATILVLVTELQALLVSVFALAVMLQRIARARTAEWGVGRLRGVPRRRWWASIYAEPATAILLGLPLGLLGTWAVGRLVITRSLRPGTPVEVTHWPVLAAAGAVTVAFLAALVVVSGPNLRRPLVELISARSEAQKLTVPGAVAQSGVVLLAIATLYALLGGGMLQSGGGQLGLLAPGLFALALALLAVRLAVVIVRRVTARQPRSLAALVVGRQAARTPSTLGPAVVIAVGTALAVFASQVFVVSERNQTLRADADTGAATVLTVNAASPTALLGAVRRADPSGTQAMAVQEIANPGDTSVARIVAVDSSRFAAVTTWSPAWADVADVHAALAPPTPGPVTLTGSQVEVTTADVQLEPGATTIASAKPADPDLLLTLDLGTRWTTLNLGPVSRAGTHTAKADCANGCRLVSLGLRSEAGAPYRASFVVTGLSTDTQPAGDTHHILSDTARWRSRVGDQTSADPRSRATASGTPGGLTVEAFDLDGAKPALVLAADAVDPLPAIVSAQTNAEPFAGVPNAVIGRGLDGQAQLLTIVGHASVLPRSLNDGVLVDLANAAALSDPGEGQRLNEVWLAPGAPATIEQALTDAGLTITGHEQRAAVAQDLLQQPSTRAASTAVWLGALALVLALVAFVGSRVADMARRTPDWHSLRDAGLSRRTVRGLARIEIAVPAVIGVLLGLASGVLASLLALPRLPLVDVATPGPPLNLGIAWAPVGLIAAVVLIAVGLVAVLGASAETREAR